MRKIFSTRANEVFCSALHNVSVHKPMLWWHFTVSSRENWPPASLKLPPSHLWRISYWNVREAQQIISLSEFHSYEFWVRFYLYRRHTAFSVQSGDPLLCHSINPDILPLYRLRSSDFKNFTYSLFMNLWYFCLARCYSCGWNTIDICTLYQHCSLKLYSCNEHLPDLYREIVNGYHGIQCTFSRHLQQNLL